MPPAPLHERGPALRPGLVQPENAPSPDDHPTARRRSLTSMQQRKHGLKVALFPPIAATLMTTHPPRRQPREERPHRWSEKSKLNRTRAGVVEDPAPLSVLADHATRLQTRAGYYSGASGYAGANAFLRFVRDPAAGMPILGRIASMLAPIRPGASSISTRFNPAPGWTSHAANVERGRQLARVSPESLSGEPHFYFYKAPRDREGRLRQG